MAAAQRWPEHVALALPGSRLSYSQLLARAIRRARSLRALGIGAGDHVGLFMPNRIEYVEILFGTALLGAIAVPINARYKERELGYIIENADLDILITTDLAADSVDFVELVRVSLPGIGEAENVTELHLSSAPRLRSVVVLGGSQPDGMLSQGQFEAAVERISEEEIEQLAARVAVRSVCIMIYTSGTTDLPKGCPLTHEALVRSGRAMSRQRFLLTADDVFWDPLPMFHMSAILPITAVFDAGATFLSMTHFEPDAAIGQIVTERPTVLFPSFPTLTTALIHHSRWGEVDLARVRVVNNVASPDMLKAFQAAYPDAVQVSAYGLTEAAGWSLSTNLPTLSTNARPRAGVLSQGSRFVSWTRKRASPEASTSMARSTSGVTASSRATTGTRRRRQRRWMPTVGFTRGTSAVSTPTGASATTGASRTCSKSEVKTSQLSRSSRISAHIRR